MLKTLTRQSDFQTVYETGRKQVSRSFVLFYLPHAEFRYAVVASKKTIGNAVHRNRAKRLLRELVRSTAAPLLSGRQAGYLTLVARAAVLKTGLEQMKEELAKCLKNWLSD
ncbi:ribonuclease P [Candidatus Termititenax dinenymphae]|uniref:Ribonuclease P protein component n=1 Tax=Candidatus Termititenax dinenymphae TaxID=2218523 RepID=A0A388TK77_9BACT|nr:ribonuclease P [Candidatus Termititenax dinenymphae]